MNKLALGKKNTQKKPKTKPKPADPSRPVRTAHMRAHTTVYTIQH